jgi:hypothetical protein
MSQYHVRLGQFQSLHEIHEDGTALLNERVEGAAPSFPQGQFLVG